MAAGVLALSAASPGRAETPAPKLTEVESPGAAKEHDAAYRTDTVQVRLAAAGDSAGGHRTEYMVQMNAGDPLVYSWTAAGAEDFWHEFHGHTPQTVTFYEKAAGGSHQGSLTAPFDGIHGWYFENRTAKPVVVEIRLGGFYRLTPDER